MENTLENNRLIAEFMGARISNGGNIITKNSEGIEQSQSAENMKYHLSWDWLMPVVQKCTTTYIDKHKFVKELRLFNKVIYSDIQEIYKEVVEYINWFNKQDRVPLS